MLDLILDHLWQSTLVAFAAGMLSLILRRQSAAVRHRVWMVASLKFLVPLAALTLLGSRFSFPATEPEQTDGARWQNMAIQIVQPMSAPGLRNSAGTILTDSEAPAARQAPAAIEDEPSPGSFAWLPIAAVITWALGAMTIAMIWAQRWFRLRGFALRARPFTLGIREAESLEIRVTDARIEPGVFGIRRPLLLLPEGIVARLSPAELAAIVRHERCHIDRHDNLTSLIQMIVAALFWFHPLVWWIGSRLIAERERACDEAVLAAGAHPNSYANGILEVCSFYLESPLPCASGVGGGSLAKRIRWITLNRPTLALGAAHKALLLALPVAVLALPFWVGLLTATPAIAQNDVSVEPNESIEAFLARREYFAQLGPIILGPAEDNQETNFVIALRECELDLPADADGDQSAASNPPAIDSIPTLIAYAFDVEQDRVIVADALRTIRLATATRDRPRIEEAACRGVVRRSLQEHYGLVTRSESGDDEIIVERLEWPGPPPPAVALSAPGLDVGPATLDRYTGYFFLSNTESTTLTPIFSILREGPALLIEWNGERFDLAATSPTEFSAPDYVTWNRQQQLAARFIFGSGNIQNAVYTLDGRRIFVETDAQTLDFRFEADGDVSIINDFMRKNWSTDPISRARRIDTSVAEAAIADLERRQAQNLPDPASESMLRAMIENLNLTETSDGSTAGVAARQLRDHLEQALPGVAARLGNPREISLRRVLPSGRDVYDVVFDWLALNVTMGTDADGTGVPLEFRIYCQRQSETHIERYGGCRSR